MEVKYQIFYKIYYKKLHKNRACGKDAPDLRQRQPGFSGSVSDRRRTPPPRSPNHHAPPHRFSLDKCDIAVDGSTSALIASGAPPASNFFSTSCGCSASSPSGRGSQPCQTRRMACGPVPGRARLPTSACAGHGFAGEARARLRLRLEAGAPRQKLPTSDRIVRAFSV